jgi:aryl-alcohol dehydrogenase-like predicted oxidoreductase
LSGKYGKNPTGPTRHDAAKLNDQQRAAAEAVESVADEIGATSSQVAIAWTAARSKAIVPIIGARSLPQLTDNLGAIDVTLTAEQVERLTAATDFSRGFPHDFIDGIAPWVFGKARITE